MVKIEFVTVTVFFRLLQFFAVKTEIFDTGREIINSEMIDFACFGIEGKGEIEFW